MADVRLKDVTKIFEKDVVAVDRINLEVKDGEFVVLVGPSGCGKSTTLRMVAGLEEVSEGEIYIDGRLVNEVAPKDRDIAMVFQNYALYPHMTVYENLAFGLKLRKYPKDQIQKQVWNAASILGITELLNRKPKALSGGQRQRVAVGRAIVRRPKVFLFDEPLSNLDAKLRVQMRAEIIKLHQRLETTMIYVTHDQMEAMTMGDRIVVMKDGLVQQIDTPMALYHRPVNKFVAGFIGSPAMNFMDCRVVHNSRWLLDSGTLRIPLPERLIAVVQPYLDQQVIVGFRPEDLHHPKSGIKALHQVSIHSSVDVVEPMGNEVFVYLHSGEHQFIARLDPAVLPRAGASLELILDLDNIHLFDKTTEKAIERTN